MDAVAVGASTAPTAAIRWQVLYQRSLLMMMVVVVSPQNPRPPVPEISVRGVPVPRVMMVVVVSLENDPRAAIPAISVGAIPSPGMMMMVMRDVILGEFQMRRLHLQLVVRGEPGAGVRHGFEQVGIGRRRRNGMSSGLARNRATDQKSRGCSTGKPECFNCHGDVPLFAGPLSRSSRYRPRLDRLLQTRNNFYIRSHCTGGPEPSGDRRFFGAQSSASDGLPLAREALARLR